MDRLYKQGVDRMQESFLPPRVEDYVSADNPVRAIDAYINSLNLSDLGFKNSSGSGKVRGQPAFSPAIHLKLYLWGYLNRIRSSRRLELECRRNLELIWLLNSLQPKYHSIADFRKDNPSALRNVHRQFILLCKKLDLFSSELIALDSVYLEGDASRNSVYTKGNLRGLIKKIDKDIDRYNNELNRVDTVVKPCSVGKFSDKLARLVEEREQLEELQESLEDSDSKQLSFTDSDARMLSKKTDKGPTVGYTVQATVDSKNKLLVTCDVMVDSTDSESLFSCIENAKEILGVEKITAVADSGYYSEKGLVDCEDNGTELYLPIPDKDRVKRAKGQFERIDFKYDEETDSYSCPAGSVLSSHGTYERSGRTMFSYYGKQSICKNCNLRNSCISENTKYRRLNISEHEDVIERHRVRMRQRGPDMMKTRASLAEHPFGTMKLWLGWTHFLVRGIQKVKGEMALLSTAYNFKRVLNIIGIEKFIASCSA